MALSEAEEAEFAQQRQAVIDARVTAALGTGRDVALWERYDYDAPSPNVVLVFRDIAAGSTPQFSPCGFEASPCTVFRTSQVKMGKA